MNGRVKGMCKEEADGRGGDDGENRTRQKHQLASGHDQRMPDVMQTSPHLGHVLCCLSESDRWEHGEMRANLGGGSVGHGLSLAGQGREGRDCMAHLHLPDVVQLTVLVLVVDRMDGAGVGGMVSRGRAGPGRAAGAVPAPAHAMTLSRKFDGERGCIEADETAMAAMALRYTASTDLDPRRDRYRLHRPLSLGGTGSHLLLPARAAGRPRIRHVHDQHQHAREKPE